MLLLLLLFRRAAAAAAAAADCSEVEAMRVEGFHLGGDVNATLPLEPPALIAAAFTSNWRATAESGDDAVGAGMEMELLVVVFVTIVLPLLLLVVPVSAIFLRS